MTYEEMISARETLTGEERDALNEEIAALVLADGDRLKAVNGDYFRIDGDELADRIALETAWQEEEPARLALLVSAEAERRIETGILVDAMPFRADDASAQRIGELLASFEAGLVGAEGVSFRTQAGATFTLTETTQARAIRDALLRYRAACLEASAALQESPPDDPEDDAHWPAVETVLLS